MDAKNIDYELKPFTITLAGVFALEFFAMTATGADPLLVTGIVRTLQAVFISAVAFRFKNSARIAGLGPGLADLAGGIKKGLVWSLIFGTLAAIVAVCIAIAGFDPVEMIGVGLPSDTKMLIVFLLVAALIGPFAEELLFRGVIYGFLRKYGALAAVFGSSALFVLAHSFEGIALTHVIGAIVFAVVYEYEKNIMVPVTIHALGNLAMFSTGFLS